VRLQARAGLPAVKESKLGYCTYVNYKALLKKGLVCSCARARSIELYLYSAHAGDEDASSEIDIFEAIATDDLEALQVSLFLELANPSLQLNLRTEKHGHICS